MIVEQFIITVSREHLEEWRAMERREATICIVSIVLFVAGFFLVGTAVSINIRISAEVSFLVFGKSLPTNVGAALMILGIAMLIFYCIVAAEMVRSIAGGALDRIMAQKRRIIYNYGRYPVEQIGTEHARNYARYILKEDTS